MPQPFGAVEGLAGRRLLLTGSTGFIGKVTLAMLLERQPEVGQVYVLVRARLGREPGDRFLDAARSSPAFESLRKASGAGFEAFLREKVTVLCGDATEPELGLSPEDQERLKGIDAIVNIAGLVAFNPPLDESLRANAYGALYAARLAAKLGTKLVHMSTAYVSGLRPGLIREDEPVADRSPDGMPFSASDELAECEAFMDGLESESAKIAPHLSEGARRRRVKRWIEERLLEEGIRRAKSRKWPNVYCFTKAIGEQLIARTPGLDFTIVRPSVVESSVQYPFPGWNEGLNTSAPVILAMCTGHALWPAHPTAAFDVIPVDLVAGATLAVTAAALAGRHQRVYHLASSDTNRFTVRQCMRYVGQYRRLHWRDHAPGALWSQWLWTRPGVVTVVEPVYRLLGIPAWRRGIEKLGALLARDGKPPKLLARWERDMAQVEHVIATFMPFIHDIDCVFSTRHLRDLYEAMPERDRKLLPGEIAGLDWRSYWLEIHTEGLRRWVFPGFPGRNGGPLRPSYAPAVNRAMRWALSTFQKVAYGRLFRSEAEGTAHIPQTPGFIIASNHASHLDMGLIKVTLGDAGHDLVALAAKDYFFKNPVLGYFFRNYTNLLPIGRSSAVKDSLEEAVKRLRQGRTLLLFPEATRSTTGAMAAFRSTVGYLALKARADVVPAYVAGTYESLPKGRLLPRSRRLKTYFGEPIPYTELRRLTAGLSPKDASRAATRLIEVSVKRLEERARQESIAWR